MRDHPRAADPSTQRALAILLEEDPSDVFSLMQWSVGLPYFQQRLAAWDLSGDVCLDFGCGAGNWALAASCRFGQVVGVDVHAQRLRAAVSIRDALDIRNVTFEPHYSPPAAGAVDCILLYNVLQYVGDRSETIRHLVSFLKPTGLLVVSFNEIGVCPYYFVSGIRCLRRTYLRKAFAGPRYFLVERLVHSRSAFESTHGWLRTAEVLSFFDGMGFDALWTSWQAPPDDAARPLFPHRRFGLPFFREILFRRR